ncbi:MAG: type I methionyl aminopeptidase [Gemmatimonadota bacterium]|nr:MAG: type I methionyl aminopeptidase [Gemmatimonadota bacterium]
MIVLKSEKEIESIHESCHIVYRTLKLIEQNVHPGVTSQDLNTMAEEFIIQCGGRPAFKGFHGFPASICVSIDDEVVHGIPGNRKLQEGQIVSIDVGVEKAGYYGDGAETFCVEPVSQEKSELLTVTRDALFEGISQAREGNRLSDISWSIQSFVERHGYSVVRALVGHGIGKAMHEEPQVPNFGSPGSGPVLKAGMTLAIEPMVNAGGFEVETQDDNWTVVTKDGSASAHFEHTIVITREGPRILTDS